MVTNSEKLSRRLYELLGKKLLVDLSKRDAVSEYIIKRTLYAKKRKYGHLGYARARHRLFSKENPVLSTFRIELQDVYLSDLAVRSHTGSITRGSVKDIIDWATGLGLLNKDKLSMTQVGQLLDTLMTREDKQAFLEETSINPYLLKPAEMIFFLRLLLELDGDIIIPLARALREKRFSRSEAGLCLLDVYMTNVSRYRPKARRGIEFKRVKMLENIIKSIQKQVRISGSSVGTKELRATARLEPLVDLKVLDKKDKFSFEYRSNKGTRLISQLNEKEIDRILMQEFFGIANKLYEFNARKMEEEENIFRFILKGYGAIRNPLGLAPMEGVSILGSIYALQTHAFFEYIKAREVLLNFHSRFQSDLRLHINKYGEIKYFVASKKIQQKYLN